MNQLCPLCRGAAQFEFYNDPRCKHFECPTCVEFCVDAYAERIVNNSPAEAKAGWSERAKTAGPDRMFVLREPKPEEGCGPGTLVYETVSLRK
jgi:hypothetical protein